MADAIEVEALGSETFLLTVSGSISFSNNQDFQEALEGILVQDPKRLLIDLSSLDFCNSQGFGDMLRAYTRLAKTSGAFGLISPTPEIRKVLEITKFSRIIEIYPSRDAALA